MWGIRGSGLDVVHVIISSRIVVINITSHPPCQTPLTQLMVHRTLGGVSIEKWVSLVGRGGLTPRVRSLPLMKLKDLSSLHDLCDVFLAPDWFSS